MKKIFLLFLLVFSLSSCTSSLPSESESFTDPDESEVYESGEVVINPSNCPQGTGNSYPTSGLKEIDGINFYFNDTMNGSGKIGKNPYIQMKKNSGLIKNFNPIPSCEIIIKMLVNYSEYAGDMTHELTLTSGTEYDIYSTSLEAETSRDEIYFICRYETNSSDKYICLANISSYAAYIEEIKISW